jgi:hypothetical protein
MKYEELLEALADKMRDNLVSKSDIEAVIRKMKGNEP